MTTEYNREGSKVYDRRCRCYVNGIIPKYVITNCVRIIVMVVVMLISSHSGEAQNLVYHPINPAFGGSYYNYSWLLSSAEAQKAQTEDETSSLFGGFGREEDPLADFSDRLQSQILNELTERILKEKFGDFSLEQGEYNVGNYQINITDSDQGLQIHILDTKTGGESRITVPNL